MSYCHHHCQRPMRCPCSLNAVAMVVLVLIQAGCDAPPSTVEQEIHTVSLTQCSSHCMEHGIRFARAALGLDPTVGADQTFVDSSEMLRALQSEGWPIGGRIEVATVESVLEQIQDIPVSPALLFDKRGHL